MRRIIVAIALSLSITGVAAMHSTKSVNKLWVGIGYIAATQGATPEQGAAVGIVGVWDAAVMGAGFGTAFGPGVGTAVGAAVGL